MPTRRVKHAELFSYVTTLMFYSILDRFNPETYAETCNRITYSNYRPIINVDKIK